MRSPEHETAFQRLYDAANKILEATYNDEETARQAIQALSVTRTRLEQRIGELAREVTEKVDASALRMAHEAARLLAEKFTEADDAAERARDRYNKVGRRLTWKLLGGAAVLQCLLLAGAWLIVERTLPSQAEIEARRQTIEQLSQQASESRTEIGNLQRDANTMTRKVTSLERRGGRLELTNCAEEGQPARICIRTNEGDSDAPITIGDKTFRIPWGY
ncbi:hypothetical protein R69927_05638 [Paraburkholderia domus]|uniref:hypothetical protein n=1 Tax=Paraburkholderia domus TaxID=2793075 RepID=UPI001911A26A|nr:hypothetical protein [Paraburkholderia domus]MBK5089885.1 hypothetical protein [Burkholderia sp. R-69927]CAE6905340.1 hypothetical protein R69927_05638 [Paraburkholderia domus]